METDMVVRAEKEHSGLQGYRLLLAVLGTLDFQLTRLKKKKDNVPYKTWREYLKYDYFTPHFFPFSNFLS